MADKSFYGPLWVLPAVTGAGVNAGVSLMTGQTAETTEYYEAAAKGIIVSCPSANSGDAYLVAKAADGTFKITNAGTVVMVIPKGTTRQFPQAEYGSNRYKLADYAVCAAMSDLAYPVGIMQ
jgi:hypothetical protein